MDLSIIIPMYNTSKNKLYQCYDSIRRLSGFDYEVLTVDDGSDVKAAEHCKNYVRNYNNFKYFRQNNMGVSAARNFGVEKALGKYLMFVDSDDEIIADPINDFMSQTIKKDKGGGYDVVVFDRYFLKRKKKTYNTVLKESEANDLQELLKSFILNRGIGWIHGLLYKRSFLIENSLRFSSNTIQQEDRDFNFELFKYSPQYLYINKAVYIYHYGMKSTIERWKKNPESMIDSGTTRYLDNINFLKHSRFTDADSIKEQIVKKRIELIYSNAVDLYCAGRMSNVYKNKLTKLMQSLILPSNSKKNVINKYYTIIHQRWNSIRIYAIIRLTYLKITGIW